MYKFIYLFFLLLFLPHFLLPPLLLRVNEGIVVNEGTGIFDNEGDLGVIDICNSDDVNEGIGIFDNKGDLDLYGGGGDCGCAFKSNGDGDSFSSVCFRFGNVCIIPSYFRNALSILIRNRISG